MNLKASLNKIWHVAIFEYRSRVLTWRFWLGILVIPVMLGVMLGLTYLAIFLASDNAPVGVVGGRGLDLTPPAGERFNHTFIALADEPAARAALQAHEVQAYFVLSPDYPDDRWAGLYYLKRPSASLASEFDSLLRRQALAGLPPERARRLEDGAQVILQAGRLETPAQVSTIVRLLVAFGAVYALMLLNSQVATYAITTLTEERDNRTLEILFTSLSPTQLLAGKVAGHLAVVLTQVLLFGAGPLLAVLLLRLAALPILGEIFSMQQLGVFLLAGLLNLVLVAVLLSSLGITILDPSEAQLVVMLFNFALLAPPLLYQALADAPSGPVSLVLTFFPLTSVGALVVRMALGSVPGWQVLLSLLLLFLSMLAAFGLSKKIFWRGLQERQPFKLNFTRFKSFFRRAWKPRNA